jgi:hypothetical protein
MTLYLINSDKEYFTDLIGNAGLHAPFSMSGFNAIHHVMLTLQPHNFRGLQFSSAKFKFMSMNVGKIHAQSILYGPVKFHKIFKEQLIIQMQKATFFNVTQQS